MKTNDYRGRMRMGRRLTVVVAALGLWALPLAAHSQGVLESCGNINVELQSNCEVEPPGVSCETRCTPPNVRVSCAADLVTTCEQQCTETIVETEVQVCEPNCVTECQLNPGSFSCSGSCGTRCTGGCSASCAASGDQGRCMASCEATCQSSCQAECSLVLPSASCQEICRPSCRGEIRAEVNMDCQLACHSSSFTTCETELTGGCVADCRTREGALFCDSQFVDHDDNLQRCIDALRNLEITVEGSFSFSADAGCGLVRGAKPSPFSVALLLLGLIGLWRRRR